VALLETDNMFKNSKQKGFVSSVLLGEPHQGMPRAVSTSFGLWSRAKLGETKKR